jgi:hypothetical protein
MQYGPPSIPFQIRQLCGHQCAARAFSLKMLGRTRKLASTSHQRTATPDRSRTPHCISEKALTTLSSGIAAQPAYHPSKTRIPKMISTPPTSAPGNRNFWIPSEKKHPPHLRPDEQNALFVAIHVVFDRTRLSAFSRAEARFPHPSGNYSHTPACAHSGLGRSAGTSQSSMKVAPKPPETSCLR